MTSTPFLKQKRRVYAFSKLFRRLFLKAISANQFIPTFTRTSALNTLCQTRVHGSKIRFVCRDSGRYRAFYRAFSLSRSKVHCFAGFGLLPGVKKSGW